MCNLNILIKKKSKNEEELTNVGVFLMETTLNSYSFNKDGDGFYSDGFLIKKFEKLNLLKYLDKIINSKFVITHQRIATSGFEKEFLQPFENKDFVIVHNGVINEFLEAEGSDTFGFFNEFIREFKKIKGKREKKIIKAVKNLLDNLNYGSYSIALFDKKTENLYYFKNNNTDIYFYKNHKFLYITTLKENKYLLSLLDVEFKEESIKDFNIYRINVGKTINIKKVGKIKEVESNYFYNPLPYPSYNESPKDLVLCNDLGSCMKCGQKTYFLNPNTLERICGECFEKLNNKSCWEYV